TGSGAPDPAPGLLLFLAVPDDAIGPVAEHLSQSGRWEETTVAHCSGAIPASHLQPLKQKGAAIAVFHPVQTFATGSGPETFRGICISLQGDVEALDRLEPITRVLGSTPLRVDEAGKLKLHLAAVFISNYLAGLMEAAQELTGDVTGSAMPIEQVLGPIHRKAAGNIVDAGHRQALTGPILRGDLETIKQHLQILNENPELKQLYARLGLYTLRAARHNRTEPGHEAIQILLESVINTSY
ncbi:MAG: DUF2520 domain-containing protein, partial [Rhodothermaceae bacterium]|nr:DUF2520 domain-containing protein [Rhodothermaceae bacterium]